MPLLKILRSKRVGRFYTPYTAFYFVITLCFMYCGFLTIKLPESHYVEASLFYPHALVNHSPLGTVWILFRWTERDVQVGQRLYPCLHHFTSSPLVAQSLIDSMLMAVESNLFGKRIPSIRLSCWYLSWPLRSWRNCHTDQTYSLWTVFVVSTTRHHWDIMFMCTETIYIWVY